MADERASFSACESSAKPLSAEDAQAEAEDVFEKLEGLSVTSPSGCTAWLFRLYSQRTLTEPGNGFANGVWGMAPFFAALAQTTRDESIRERALEHLEMCLDRMGEVLACLHDARCIPEKSVPLGLSSGFGGMLRALTLVHQVCGNAAIRGRVECLASDELARISRSDIENAQYASVYSGCAGLLLALCQSPWANGCDDAERAVERLVGRLADLRTLNAGSGHVVWKTLERNWPISGLGNGVAGVGAALAAAAGCGADCGEDARAAFAWERAVYSDDLGTWPDYRDTPVGSGYVHGICSGAPGVGLAAVMAHRSLSPSRPGDSELMALTVDLTELADAACSSLTPSMRDTLCCGYGSVVEYWLARGRRDDAGRLLAGEVGRKNAVGHYFFQGRQRRQNDDPSLFFGLSGVGYNLLRYANPSFPGIIL